MNERKECLAELKLLEVEYSANNINAARLEQRLKNTAATIRRSINISRKHFQRELKLLDLVHFCQTGSYPDEV